MKFSHAFKILMQGLKIRCNSWPQDYYIYLNKHTLTDSMNNIFAYDYEIFYNCNYRILDSSKDLWDIYCDDIESHL